ncbi:MAG TPA: 16S rRNA methyltransferase [candidate division Zixibacteria bacterium]|nr:16S rRNA methyltransferase [candidate division Zixibacteria bacterium]
MTFTTFVIAETALELLPNELIHLDSIKKSARKKGKQPYRILLEDSYHHKEMLSLKDSKKRGRPDILHFSLLNLLGSPEILTNPSSYRILVHTYDDKIININPEIRLPRHYFRFVGLMEQLLEKGVIRSKEENLMEILHKSSLENELKNIPKERRILFTSKGAKIDLFNLFKKNAKEDIALIVGGFPHGNFSKKIDNLSENKIAIANLSLDAWIVICRIMFLREMSLIRSNLYE